jgi:hypothetical protein
MVKMMLLLLLQIGVGSQLIQRRRLLDTLSPPAFLLFSVPGLLPKF